MNPDRSSRASLAHSLALLGLAVLLGCGGSTASDPASPGTAGAPVLTAIYPETTYAGASDQTLTLVGSGFVAGATVEVNGVGRAASFVSASHLAAPIAASSSWSPRASRRSTGSSGSGWAPTTTCASRTRPARSWPA